MFSSHFQDHKKKVLLLMEAISTASSVAIVSLIEPDRTSPNEQLHSAAFDGYVHDATTLTR
jgi:hypothetical protein